MLNSMTGFGSGKAQNKSISAEVEVKSINSRYLDISLKLPPNFFSLDYELKETIKNKINRGKVIVSIQIKFKKLNSNTFSVDENKLKILLNLINEIKKKSKISEEVKLEHILGNKDFFLSEESVITEENINTIKKALVSALDNLAKTKKNEGKELEKDLLNRVVLIEEALKEIEQESTKSVKENFENLKAKALSLIDNSASRISSDRLELELALLAEKADITEECTRLKSHLKFFVQSVKSDDDSGRKLNFLCQEMHRETNTISSKTVSSAISHKTVLIKEEIEKIREQIQNVE